MNPSRPPCTRPKDYRLAKHNGLVVAKLTGAAASPCDHCQDGYLPSRDGRGYEFLEPCPYHAFQARLERFNAIRIPERYAHCDLGSYQPQTAEQQAALQRVEKHVKQFYPPFPGFVFWGPVGTGKTHLMVAILRELAIEKGIGVRFVDFTHMLSEIKEGFSQGRHEAEVLGPICRIPVLGIDELGKGLISDWQLSILDEVISRRYNSGVTTYLTTNLPLEGSKPNATPMTGRSGDLRRELERVYLADKVGERIFSRLHEMCVFVKVDGPDHRRQSKPL